MNASGVGRGAALLLSALLFAAAAEARDVYKAFLDPGIPRHRAILDTLERLQKDPKDASLKNDLGCLVAQDGFWRDALREFDEAAALAPKDSRPLFNAGLVQTMRGEWRGARGYFGKATSRDPGNWPAWWMKGFAEEQLGNAGAAVAAYKTSLRAGTSLFDVAVNPYAAWTDLKARVFVESYEDRRTKTALGTLAQLADQERVARFFQKSKKVAVRTDGGRPAEDSPVVAEAQSGPVITSVPAVSTSAPSRGDPGLPVWRDRPAAVREGRSPGRGQGVIDTGSGSQAPAPNRPPSPSTPGGETPAPAPAAGPAPFSLAPAFQQPPPTVTPVPK